MVQIIKSIPIIRQFLPTIKSLLYAKNEDILLIKLLKKFIRWFSCCSVLMCLFVFLSVVAFFVCLHCTNDWGVWYFYADTMLDRHKQICIPIGDKIVFALKAYYKDNGEYPDELEQLIPDYLDEIPELPVGTKKWQYTGKKDLFFLLFSGNRVSNYPNCTYVSELDQWCTDQ
jgi:hypothetical protein